MNKQTELLVSELSKTVSLINNGAKAISSDIYSQIPDICNQIVLARLMASIFGVIWNTLLICFFIFLAIFFRKKAIKLYEHDKNEASSYSLYCFFCCSAAFVLFIFLGPVIQGVFKCKYTPKIVVIEFIKSENRK